MKNIIILLSLVGYLNSYSSGNMNSKITQVKAASKGSFDHMHTLLTNVLKKYVVPGKVSSLVKYDELKKNRSELDNYLKGLESLSKSDFSKFNNDQKLSFWINAYNAYTLELIIDNYPLKSIKDLGSLFKSPWKKKFIKLFNKTMSLDGIEHDTIRKQFKEPRIHFAVNCASMGCPSIANEAFTESNLESLLQERSLHFINNDMKNSFNATKKTMKISKIFDWYGVDFNEKFGSYQNFIQTLKPEIKGLAKFKVKWSNYGWGLNDSK